MRPTRTTLNYAALFVALLSLTSFTAGKLPKTFTQLLTRAKMTFEAPAGLTQTDPIENKQMNWELAYKHATKKFEVRYAIRPMDDALKVYEEREANKKEGDINIHPNKWYRSTFEMTVLNISGGQLPEYTVFDAQAVKKEFNADWGATTSVEVVEEFGKGYTFCLFVFIHKENLGDGYIFYMADEADVISEEMGAIFHALKFQKD